MSFSSSSEMSISSQRKTAKILLQAFNTMNIPLIISLRSSICVREILPSTLNFTPQSNDKYESSLSSLIPIFSNFSLTCHEFVEDLPARKIVMYLRARADTKAGEYRNEYVWFLRFDEEGLIDEMKEYVDTVMYRDFWPKLKEAMRQDKLHKDV